MMAETLHLQLSLPVAPDRIFSALTTTLPAWFAEHADVSLAEKRYDFWGRYTPENPDRAAGHHPLLEVQPDQHLKFGWALRGEDTTVDLMLKQRGGETLVIARHHNVTPSHDIDYYTHEDFWFLSLENLRRHLDGKPPVRCDFSVPMVGDIHHTLEIDGSREAVFETLIRPDQLERWIASRATVEPVVGGKYDLGWIEGAALKILELVPNEKLAYNWPDYADPNGQTVVTWALEESGGKTRLTFVHSGFAPDKKNGGLNAGWLNYASSVRSIVEFGAGWKPPAFRIRPGLESIYAASIIAQQADLLDNV